MNLGFGFVLARENSKAGSTIDQTGKDSETAFTGKGNASDAPAFAVLHSKTSGAPDGAEIPIEEKRQRLQAALQALDELPARNLGGRKTYETEDTFAGVEYYWTTQTKQKQRLLMGLATKFDVEQFARWDFDELVDILSDLSPEISNALWTYILMCNSGYETKALNPTTGEIDQRAQAKLDEMLKMLGEYHGTLGVFFDRLFKMIFQRGSFLLELVLAENGRDFIDIATPDTKTLKYKRKADPLRGQVWTFGQIQNGVFVDLNIPTIKYIPIHPSGDSIEGHSIIAPSLFAAIFLLSVLRDTKRVVQHQGYLRLDIEVQFEKLKDTMPEDIATNPAAVKEWQQRVVNAVREVYSSLEPDDTYIHDDSIVINNPVGTVSADSLGAIDALFKALERTIIRALKTMPLLAGATEGTSEANANRQWEIYAKGIESIQHFVESAFEYVMTYALNAQGIYAKVEHRFAQFRAAEAMRDEQVQLLKVKVADALYQSGIISQDEKANYAFGKEKADVPEPRKPVGFEAKGFGNETTTNPNEGEERFVKFIIERAKSDDAFKDIVLTWVSERQPTLPEIDEADAFMENYAPEIAKELFDADVETDTEQ